MRNLRRLYLWRCGLRDVSGLAGLSRLVELGLADNELTDVTPLGDLARFELLYLGGNPLPDDLLSGVTTDGDRRGPTWRTAAAPTQDPV